MNNYVGMCVGGPKDGMYVYQKQPYFEIPIYDKIASLYMIESNVSIAHEVYVYKHMIGLRGTFVMDFWANEKEFPSLEKIICHIFSEYCTRERSR